MGTQGMGYGDTESSEGINVFWQKKRKALIGGRGSCEVGATKYKEYGILYHCGGKLSLSASRYQTLKIVHKRKTRKSHG